MTKAELQEQLAAFETQLPQRLAQLEEAKNNVEAVKGAIMATKHFVAIEEKREAVAGELTKVSAHNEAFAKAAMEKENSRSVD